MSENKEPPMVVSCFLHDPEPGSYWAMCEAQEKSLRAYWNARNYRDRQKAKRQPAKRQPTGDER